MPYDGHNLGFLAVKELLDFENIKPVYKFLSFIHIVPGCHPTQPLVAKNIVT